MNVFLTGGWGPSGMELAVKGYALTRKATGDAAQFSQGLSYEVLTFNDRAPMIQINTGQTTHDCAGPRGGRSCYDDPVYEQTTVNEI